MRKRLDADFFAHPETERLEAIERDPRALRIEDICLKKTSGFTPKLPNLKDGEAKFITIDCISSLRLHEERFKNIPLSAYEAGFSKTRRIAAGSVLCTIKRRICQAYPFIENPKENLAFNQDIALLVPNDERVSAVFLAAYLGSSIGQALANREQTEQMNPYLSLIGLGNLPIVPVGKAVDEGISRLFFESNSKSDTARQKRNEAEDLLLDALGLREWSPPEPLAFTASANEVREVERFDANYFAPKYLTVLEKLISTNAAHLLGDGLTKLVSRGQQPKYGIVGLPVINSKHVRVNRVLLSDANRVAQPGKHIIQKGDVLINGTGVGTIGRAAPYLEDQQAVPDNHVTIVRPIGIDPLYLSVFLNSPVGQMQVDRMISGSSGQIELYPDDVKQILVWNAPEALQIEIAEAIQQSFELEGRANQLLVDAKRAVEIAIEGSEAAALAYIAEQETAYA
ncbi:hypothetical protein [Sphingorhabdus sp. SMR4y]|uniref:hypothetical protein n=1 Tax=Sphingorhabdus sp. SMR4y TaxID=2584094 RepID=UPI000B5C7427|nr:hypothetical protein [Sphingorhabdus sp. SMR4y]ASK88361.1 hypothetical protein SPHFLASMR4Y_01613 [Sphingorhabdus sp. SMR4y]